MDNKVIAEKLIALRGDTSRDEVAKDLGLSVSAIGMYERGERIPKDDLKEKIADYYNVSVQDIFYCDSMTL